MPCHANYVATGDGGEEGKHGPHDSAVQLLLGDLRKFALYAQSPY